MARNVRIDFEGGTLIFPNTSGYDLQIIVENILERARRYERIRVTANSTSWKIESRGGQKMSACTVCDRQSSCAIYAGGQDGALASCVRCFFGGESQ